MATNLENLMSDLEQKSAQDTELNRDNLPEAALTEDDMKIIDKMKAENPELLMVNETGPDGQTVSTPVQEYAKSLDTRVKPIMNDHTIKVLNSGNIVQTVEELRAENLKRAKTAYEALASVVNDDITPDQIMEINNHALDALKERFKLTRITTEAITAKIRNMNIKQLSAILPGEFIQLYVDTAELKASNFKAAERIKSVISYLCAVGPDMDYLNQYIDDENKLAMVSKRILQCQLDFNEMLRDESKMSEFIARSVAMSPDDSVWPKYIKMPNRVHNEFAQRYVIQEHYRDAYQELLKDYPVIEDETGMTKEQLDANNVNRRAQDIIRTEITEAENKMEVYKSISDLTLLRELMTTLSDRYKNGVKLNQVFLMKEAKSAIERISRCKQNLPFPGWSGTISRADIVYPQYLQAYATMIGKYNVNMLSAADKAMKDETLSDAQKKSIENCEIYPIVVVGHDSNDVYLVFSTVLLILMGRLVRKLSNHDCTKYDAIVLDSYFQIFCRLGTDIYMMSDIWEICHDLVEYILTNVKLTQKWK